MVLFCCAPCIAQRRLKKKEEVSSLQLKTEQGVQTGEEEDRLGDVRSQLAEAEAHAAQLSAELAQAHEQLQRQEQDFEARLDQLRTEYEQKRQEREDWLDEEMRRLKSGFEQQGQQRERESEEHKEVLRENERLHAQIAQQEQRRKDSEEAHRQEVQQLQNRLAAAEDAAVQRLSSSQNPAYPTIAGTGMTAARTPAKSLLSPRAAETPRSEGRWQELRNIQSGEKWYKVPDVAAFSEATKKVCLESSKT